MSVIRERDWDTESVHGDHRHYTTVRRYKVPEAISRDLRDDNYEEDKVIIRRETHPAPAEREVRKYYVDREIDREIDVEIDSPRGETEYRIVKHEAREERAPRGNVREFRFEREYSRSPSPEARSYRYERERDVEVQRDRYAARSPYEVERYSKSTEYFSQPNPAPQPIIIRNEVPIQQAPQPIIIREEIRPQLVVRREEPSYEIIERSEVDERPLVKAAPRQDDDYYYERRTRKVDGGPRRDWDEEREYARGRYEEAGYHSDDDLVVIRRERTEDFEGGRRHEHNHKRHLAEGLVAGLGAAEIIRHHRKRQGEDPGHRGRQLIGYGALGAVGATALERATSAYRGRSRSWDREERYIEGEERRRKPRHRSLSRNKTLAGVAGLAAIGALAYAAGKAGSKNQTTVIEPVPVVRTHTRRSRSRRRRYSVDSYSSPERSRSRSASKHMDKEHRNRRMSQVGLATAALAGLAERRRSKSRERKGGKSRESSRVRTGVPIVASGLAGAAVTGLYEKARARKEEKSLSRSRSRSRSRSVPHSSRRHSTVRDVALVEYGGDPIYTDPDAERRHHHRSHSRRGRRSSSSESDRDRHHKGRSRSKHVAEAAVAAGIAGAAAHQATKRRERKKAEEEERRRQEEAESSGAAAPGSPSDEARPRPSGAPSQGRFYPDTMDFPPPPPNTYQDPGYGSNVAPGPQPGYAQPPYDPVFQQQQAPYPPAQYGSPNQQLGAPPPPQGFYQHPNTQAPQQVPYQGQSRRNPEDVSAPRRDLYEHSDSDGVRTPRPGTPEGILKTDQPAKEKEKEVHFALPDSPTDKKKSRRDDDDRDDRDGRKHDRDRSRSRSRSHSRDRDDRDRSNRKRDRHERSGSPDSVSSDSTVDLPPRFDEHGRRVNERGSGGGDPLTDKIEDLLQGRGMVGKLVSPFLNDLLGEGGGSSRRR